jgi:hypothetical protein
VDNVFDRSLKDCSRDGQKHANRLITLRRLADGGYFQNSRQVMGDSEWPSIPRFFRVICSMTNLETLSLLNWKLTLTEEDLAQLFRSCPRLTELHLTLYNSNRFDRHMLEGNEEVINDLRPGFERLRLFELKWGIYSWPVIQRIFT